MLSYDLLEASQSVERARFCPGLKGRTSEKAGWRGRQPDVLFGV